jgi:hypothetical protein
MGYPWNGLCRSNAFGVQWIVGIQWKWIGYIECILGGTMGSCGSIRWMRYNECIWGTMDSWGWGHDWDGWGIYIEHIWVTLDRWGKLDGMGYIEGMEYIG